MLFYMPKAGPKAVKTFVHAQWIVKETTLPFLVSTPIFSQCFDSKKFAVRKYPHTYALYTLLFFFYHNNLLWHAGYSFMENKNYTYHDCSVNEQQIWGYF